MHPVFQTGPQTPTGFGEMSAERSTHFAAARSLPSRRNPNETRYDIKKERASSSKLEKNTQKDIFGLFVARAPAAIIVISAHHHHPRHFCSNVNLFVFFGSDAAAGSSWTDGSARAGWLDGGERLPYGWLVDGGDDGRDAGWVRGKTKCLWVVGCFEYEKKAVKNYAIKHII